MMKGILLATLLGLLSLGHAIQCPKQKTSPGREVVCYTSVSDVQQLTDSICRCTTLVHQGHDVRNLSSTGFENFQKSLKRINPPLQFVISVDDPENTLRTSGTIRQETTAHIIRILKEIDGVELNMTAGTKERLFHFVKGLKDEMVRKSYDKRLFMVLPTKSEYLAKQFDLKELTKYVDLFTLATDYLVEDDESFHTFHPSRLMGLFDMVNTDSLIDLISGLGAPKRKILVSLPASAYRFTLKDEDDNAPRAPTTEKMPVIIDRKQLCDLMNEGEWTIERDEDLTAPYAFKKKMWIAFEDKISVGIKGKYALLRDLPGLAIRGIENDLKTKCGKALTQEIHHSFSNFKRKSRAAVLNALEDDLHQAQITYSNQVKSSDFRVVRVVDTEGHIRAVRENTQTEFACPQQGYFVHPKSCNRFYRCVKFNQEIEEYSVFEFDCPAGLAFDERTEVCVWPGSLPQGSPCPGSSEIAPVARVRFECPSKPGYYADPQNGRWFFACMDLGGPGLMAYEFRCPYGLVFDEQKLVCEWPWLVPGYSDTGYTRTEYDYRGHGAESTEGGYEISSLSHGYSGSAGGGDYSGSTGYAGGDGHSGGSGFSGAAGVGYSGSNVHGGYSGGLGFSNTAGAGHAGSGAEAGHSGGSGFSGAAGVGYTGSGAQAGHSGGSGFSGAAGVGYTGSGAQAGHSGGSGFSGAAGVGYTGSGAQAGHSEGSGFSGAAGAGYSGGTHGGPFGQGYESTGAGYSGSTVGNQGGYSGYTGSSTHGGYSGGLGFSNTANTGHAGSGAQAGHSGSSGFSGATGAGYTGSGAQAGHSGSSGFSGATGAGYTGSGAQAGHSESSGFSGATGAGYTGSGAQAGHSGGSGFSGGTHGGPFGQGYESTGAGYSGSTVGSQGGYSGSIGHAVDGSYTGSAPTGFAGTGTTGFSESTNSGYYGSSGGGYSGSSHGGSNNAGYSGSSNGVYSGATRTDQTSPGGAYAGSGGKVHSGVTGGVHGNIDLGYTGSNGGYSGSTFGGQAGTGYSGSTINVYQGSTSGSHGGSSETGFRGSVDGGHTSEAGYSGSTVNKNQGSTSGCRPASSGSGCTASFGGGYSGGAQYTGSEYSTSAYDQSGVKGGGYSGSHNVQYPGFSTGPDRSGSIGYGSGSTYSGSSGTAQGQYSSGSKHTGSGNVGYTESSQGGYSVPGQTITVGTSPAQVPIYSSTGGGYSGSTIVHGQTPGVTLVGPTHDLPSVSYIPSTPGFSGHSGVTSTGNQGYSTSQIIDHGNTAGSFFPGRPGISTTFYGNTGTGEYVTNDSNYPSGIKGGVVRPDNRSNLNITLFGTGTPSDGTAYHGGFTPTGYVGGNVGTGAIVTGSSVQGSIITDDSLSGSVLTHGDTSGTVLTGVSEQGTILTGNAHPGYTKTGSSAPGYVTNDGVKTVYTGSARPGTVLYGTPAPGVILSGTPGQATIIRGESSPGIILTGQTASGGSLGGSIEQGTVVGSTGSQFYGESGYSTYQGSGVTKPSLSFETPRVGSVPVTFDTGYKTNEYHDNGGRGTIKFNNGYVTSKYTENDIPDYRPAGVTIPETIISGGVENNVGVSFGTTVSRSETQTQDYSSVKSGTVRPSGFTKTGPTKTGITTATLGGRGSYVVSTGKSRPATNPEQIGEKAFEGNVAGYTRTSTESSFNNYAGSTSTRYQDVNHIDSSKITLGPGQSTGYSYPKPSVQFVTGVTESSRIPYSPSEGSVVSTPPSYLNVEVYNTPKIVDSAPVTASPAVVNTYSYSKSTEEQYQSGTFGKVPSGFTRKPTSTIAPVVYTSGPPDNYKTTLFEAARIPVVISTIQPPVDDGYKTVISPTVVPSTVTRDKFGGSYHTGSAHSPQFDVGIGSTAQQGGFGDRTGYVSVTTSSPRLSGPSIAVAVPTATYELPHAKPHATFSSSTVSPDTGYSYATSKNTFRQNVTPSSSISESLKPQTQYLPSDSVSPTIGVTHRKPFPAPGITYQQSTPRPAMTTEFSKTYSESSYSEHEYSGSKTTLGSNYGGSPTNIGISRNEVDKLITNYNRGTTKYIPSQYDTYSGSQFSGSTTSIGSNDFNRKQSSSSYFGQSHGTPETVSPFVKTQKPSTSYPGGYSKSYEVTTQTAVGKGKVIVKWSDLHPLLLGKLGAECTCRADPFANLRGPGSKKIASSKGQVDLSNYDESEIYVDLEKDSGSYEDGDYVTNYEVSSQGPVKIWPERNPALDNRGPQSFDKPSSTYLPSLPSTVAPSSNVGLHGRIPEFPGRNNGFQVSTPSSLNIGSRSGKNLNIAGSTTNSVGGQGAAFDRFGSGGLRNTDETIEGATDCARPGLFRHPNFCNKFYACHWDDWKKKFTLHVFNCPVHLTFDNSAGACNWPSKGPACQDDNLLV